MSAPAPDLDPASAAAGLIGKAMSLQHIHHLSDERGLVACARGADPDPTAGYVLRDQARLLVVALRHRFPVPGLAALIGSALQFVLEAQDTDGSFHSRWTAQQRWADETTAAEDWGWAMWACGTAAVQAGSPGLRRAAQGAYLAGLAQRSIHLRPMSLAALGAAAVLAADPTHDPSLDLLADTADLVWASYSPPGWPWPETRLTRLNAVVPAAMVLASGALGRLDARAEAVEMLRWLVDRQTNGSRISVTGPGGWGPGDPRPAAEQSPVEVAALAEAAALVRTVDADPLWTQTVLSAGAWFLGHNDAGEPMISAATGGCYDLLRPDGPPGEDQTAGATLAMIAAVQCALSVGRGP